MSKKQIGLVVFICMAAVAVMLFFMKKSADKAREISDQYLKEFKTIDKDLQQHKSKIDTLLTNGSDSLIKANN